MTPAPSIGDIWEWHSKDYDDNIQKYIDFYDIVLVLTSPTKRKHPTGDYELIFSALVLDGRDAGMIEDWYMYESDRENWRQLA